MNIDDLIRQARERLSAKLAERQARTDELAELRSALDTEDTTVTEDQVRAVIDARKALDADIEQMQARVAELEAEKASDEAAARMAAEVLPERSVSRQATRVGAEPRTYTPESDRRGKQFVLDVARSFVFRDPDSSERLARHMREERAERGDMLSRAVGTGAFAGLTVPQYLVELFAPHAKAGRPFADTCRHHDLPAEGMTVNIGKGTTGTSSDIQANEGDAVSETNYDDTLLSPGVQTNSGQQTMSRQSIERSSGAEDTVLEDLFRSYGTKLDSTLLNQATNGLTNVATSIAYTDGTPTAAELYPKMLAGPAAVEAALLDMDPNDVVAVMHSRRWYWLQSQLSSTWPLFGQPGAAAQQAGINYGERYGSGFRGVLPNGVPVVVDNNIATNLGAGTNEDEIYFVAQSEAHLWEDPAAPVFIRAEDTYANKLQVLLVVYGYFAYTFTRRAHAQKIGGTGLVTPTF